MHALYGYATSDVGYIQRRFGASLLFSNKELMAHHSLSLLLFSSKRDWPSLSLWPSHNCVVGSKNLMSLLTFDMGKQT